MTRVNAYSSMMRMDVDASLYSMQYDRAKHLTEPHDRNPLLSHNNKVIIIGFLFKVYSNISRFRPFLILLEAQI
ncbi:hypothetical protein BLOT_002737 [Blomia tropicalis]|nr:hypothetical protein BLOT_002737 [Blomia tropicalis]